jgi:signal transduction histidine kinase
MQATEFKFARWRWTVRLRLTLLYGALFLLSGAALLAMTYALVAYNDKPHLYVLFSGPPLEWALRDTQAVQQRAQNVVAREHAELLRQLVIQSGVALAIMSVVCIALGWFVAGWMLRPLQDMTDRVHRISELNLHERLNVRGANDELKQLGDTFDGLLSRLEDAFTAQRRFVANASHELRTPLTLQRTLIEVALSDPQTDAESLRKICERLLILGESQERLIEALLTLASSQRGLDCRELTDIAQLVSNTLRDRGEACTMVTRRELNLSPAWISGAPQLLERLVMNLIDNACRHNLSGGWVQVSTRTERGWSILRVSNSGPVIPNDRIDALFQPFHRLRPRVENQDGHGLGLSIIAAIARAHGAQLQARPLSTGGLDVEIWFPQATLT